MAEGFCAENGICKAQKKKKKKKKTKLERKAVFLPEHSGIFNRKM